MARTALSVGAVNIAGKIKFGMLANAPAVAGELPVGGGKIVAAIHGIAYGIKRGKTNTDEVFEGLYGQFEAATLDHTIIQSGILYLPTALQPNLHTHFYGEKPAEQVKFAYFVGVRHEPNSFGGKHTWYLVEKSKPVEIDPLAETRSMISFEEAEQIEQQVAKKIEHKKSK